MSQNKFNFLISLDDILDTRLATLDSIDSLGTYNILNNGYFKRTLDDWHTLSGGRIDNDKFKEVYANRNKDILKHARVTGLSPILKSTLLSADEVKANDPTHGMPTIKVNLYPYTDLTEIETAALLTAIDYSCGSPFTFVEACCFTPEMITPNYLAQNIDYAFMYYFNDWNLLHQEELFTGVARDVCVSAPRLFLKEEVSEEETMIDGIKIITPWNAAELCMFEYLKLNMVPVNNFSMLLP